MRAAEPARNAVAYLARGELQGLAFKYDLPNYGVFDEKRVFEAGNLPLQRREARRGDLEHLVAARPRQSEVQGRRVAARPQWFPLSAYRREHLRVASARVAETELPLVYVNEVGGQDELVFDGASFALSREGEVCMRLPMFQEALGISLWERQDGGAFVCRGAPMHSWPSGAQEEVYRAMVMGLRDCPKVRVCRRPARPLGRGRLRHQRGGGRRRPGPAKCPLLHAAFQVHQPRKLCARRLGVALHEISIEPARGRVCTDVDPALRITPA